MKASTPVQALPDVTLVLSPLEAFIIRQVVGNTRTTDHFTVYNENTANQSPELHMKLEVDNDAIAEVMSDLHAVLDEIVTPWEASLVRWEQ